MMHSAMSAVPTDHASLTFIELGGDRPGCSGKIGKGKIGILRPCRLRKEGAQDKQAEQIESGEAIPPCSDQV